MANLSHIDPVVVGFREDGQVQLRYQREIGYSQPWDICFDDGWILPAGKGLILNLTAPIEVTYTIEYAILGPTGGTHTIKRIAPFILAALLPVVGYALPAQNVRVNGR